MLSYTCPGEQHTGAWGGAQAGVWGREGGGFSRRAECIRSGSMGRAERCRLPSRWEPRSGAVGRLTSASVSAAAGPATEVFPVSRGGAGWGEAWLLCIVDAELAGVAGGT